MYTMRQRPMPRPKPEGEIKHFQFRMTVDETVRWKELFGRARERTHGQIQETVFNRLLLGLKKEPSILNEKERLYFLAAGEEEQAKLIGQSRPTKPHIREVSPKTKRK